ncbi:unnamed protein product [Spirodela intermedia]|uniref:Uncharacterized protein n=1 Tax=Spirodela intermedia TaxID=51605 RepID=A0A7I8LC10_SPIIN|nr:unnamed protein product [Spirodela intermedia]
MVVKGLLTFIRSFSSLIFLQKLSPISLPMCPSVSSHVGLHESWMEVGRVLGSFILRSAQQEEALHRIWYALRSIKPIKDE